MQFFFSRSLSYWHQKKEKKKKKIKLLKDPTLLLFSEPGAAPMEKEDTWAVWWGFTCCGTWL